MSERVYIGFLCDWDDRVVFGVFTDQNEATALAEQGAAGRSQMRVEEWEIGHYTWRRAWTLDGTTGKWAEEEKD